MVYARPTDLEAALAQLSERTWTVLAGGTDLYPATTSQTLGGDVLDINGLSQLRGITRNDDGWRIGARTTWTDILQADLPAAFDALKLAAREVGSVQIQNTGTLAGNLCNASPAADGVPALLVLDAEVELASSGGNRVLALADFLTGPRATQRQPGELLTAITIPAGSATGVSNFTKLGARKYLVISIAMIAARLCVEHDRIAKAAIAVGACSAVATRLRTVERALIGAPASPDCLKAVVDGDVSGDLSPIDDIRGSAAYRGVAAGEMVRRTLTGLVAP